MAETPSILEILQAPATSTDERVVSFTGPAWKITEPEMRQIIDALEHPHKKPDWWSVTPSVGAALFFALKILIEKDWKPEGLDLFGVLFGAAVAIGALVNALKQQFSGSVFHERALEYAKKMESAQKGQPPKT